MTSKKNIIFICPRYLKNHAGGAETLTKELAINAAKNGHKVELLATCASNHYTWENDFEEKSFKENGITIKLFKVNENRDLNLFSSLQQKISSSQSLTDSEEELWLNNSVNSDSMYHYIKSIENSADYFIFTPYLFGLTIKGTQIVPDKTILIPCLHDESYAYLNCVKKMFLRVNKIMFNAPPEITLAKNLYGISNTKCFFVSMGFDFKYKTDSISFKNKYNLHTPYITFAGRREEGKNFHLLMEMVKLFEKRNPGKIKFVTMGSPELKLSHHENQFIYDLGFLPENEKYDCFSGALLNCQPSLNESFSIVIMESWLCKSPVLVHRHCDVTSYWINKAKAGYEFSNYYQFEAIISHALSNTNILNEMAENGYFFVNENFNWQKIIERFENALFN